MLLMSEGFSEERARSFGPFARHVRTEIIRAREAERLKLLSIALEDGIGEKLRGLLDEQIEAAMNRREPDYVRIARNIEEGAAFWARWTGGRESPANGMSAFQGAPGIEEDER